jgi:predicted transcriptional regulator of viral defense system
MTEPVPAKPDWDQLFTTAQTQQALFTTQQAADAGFSPQLLVHHAHTGRVLRVQRGIYRIAHYPAGTQEDLIAAWLWTERAGIVSHQTALSLHELSDVLPSQIHLTLPSAWRKRRFRVPTDVVLHHADIPAQDRTWVGAVPTTSPRRTLNDCADAALTPELLRQAAQQALQRGLVTRAELGPVEQALAPFGGIAA